MRIIPRSLNSLFRTADVEAPQPLCCFEVKYAWTSLFGSPFPPTLFTLVGCRSSSARAVDFSIFSVVLCTPQEFFKRQGEYPHAIAGARKFEMRGQQTTACTFCTAQLEVVLKRNVESNRIFWMCWWFGKSKTTKPTFFIFFHTNVCNISEHLLAI